MHPKAAPADSFGLDVYADLGREMDSHYQRIWLIGREDASG